MISILGYCMTPVVLVSITNLLIGMKNIFGIIFGISCAIASTILVLKFLS